MSALPDDPDTFGPGHPEWCPVGKPEADEPHMHCSHWEDCEPCCRCGDDTPDPHCDCERCTAVRAAAGGRFELEWGCVIVILATIIVWALITLVLIR